MSKVSTIDESCKTYITSVVPQEAGVTQVIETRRAFYAGFAAAFGIFTVQIPDIEDDDQCAREIVKLNKELFQHAIKLALGED
jgi:hypothetical protein